MSYGGGALGSAAKRMAEDEMQRKQNTVMTVYDYERREAAKRKKQAKEIEKKIVDMDSIGLIGIVTGGPNAVTGQQLTGSGGGAFTSASYFQTYDFLLLNGCYQGNDAHSRIGNAVSLVSLQVRYCIVAKQTASSTLVPVNVRVMILYDMCTNGAFPKWNSVSSTQYILSDVTDYQTFSVNGATIDNPSAITSMRNNYNIERFVTLYDKLIVINNNPGGPNGFCDNVYIKLRGKNTYWKGASSATLISDIDKGSIILGVVTDTPQANLASAVSMLLSSRVRFTDD